jgi:lysylphosphatidylglycerol synthetase-like protein (DUF2156 family)
VKQVHDGRVGLATRPVAELLGDAAEHAQGVMRAEAQLIVSQVKDGIEGAIPKVTLTASAFLLATVSLVLLLVASVLFLATLMAAWAATLIVGAVVGVAALVMLDVARR